MNSLITSSGVTLIIPGSVQHRILCRLLLLALSFTTTLTLILSTFGAASGPAPLFTSLMLSAMNLFALAHPAARLQTADNDANLPR